MVKYRHGVYLIPDPVELLWVDKSMLPTSRNQVSSTGGQRRRQPGNGVLKILVSLDATRRRRAQILMQCLCWLLLL